jgi:hypothetical protein
MSAKLVSQRHLNEYNPPMPPEEEVRRTVRLPSAVDQALVELAHTQRRSVNSAIVVAVERYVRQMTARQPKDAREGR